MNTISIGRVDLSASMDLDRSFINQDQIAEATVDFAERAKKKGIVVGFGGGISFDAIPFIRNMKGLADKFETRKVVFRIDDNEERLRAGILKAMEFEVLYLQNKCDFYDRMANEDRQRMVMLSERLEVARNELGC